MTPILSHKHGRELLYRAYALRGGKCLEWCNSSDKLRPILDIVIPQFWYVCALSAEIDIFKY